MQLMDHPTGADQRETARRFDNSEQRSDCFAPLDHRARASSVTRADALPGHYIAVTDDSGAEHLVPLADAVTHVGRAIAADLRFDDVHVSRRHAIMVRYGDHVRMLDDRSTAGTFVNHRRIIATDLLEGDVVAIGPISFTYVRVR